MLKIVRRSVCATACATIAAGLFAVAAYAGPIEDRQKLMENNGDALKPLAAIAKKEAPFDPGVVKKNAEWIIDDLVKAKDLFPEGSEKGEKETWAKPEIWTDRQSFNAIIDKTIEAAKALAAVNEQANYLPALTEVGKGCQACHDKFRRPKE